jgi:hypothetical protein
VDNITICPLSSGTLAAALTSRVWHDRLLGGNREVRLKVQCIFVTSGNNTIFSRELDRRTVRSDLVSPCENPSLRTDFKHDPLIDWARENRRSLVLSCLTLVRRWIAVGKPPGALPLGSYAHYARVMGGIMDACGVDGFLANRARTVAANPEAVRWNALASAWYAQHKHGLLSTAQVWDVIMHAEGLAELFYDVLREGAHLSQKQRLGKALEAHKNRVFAATDDGKPPRTTPWRLVRSAASSPTGNALWRLQEPEKPCDGADDDQQQDRVPY